MANNIPAAALAGLSAPHPSYADLVRDLGEQAATGGTQSRWLARRLSLNRLLP
jgi:hypothetical protein